MSSAIPLEHGTGVGGGGEGGGDGDGDSASTTHGGARGLPQGGAGGGGAGQNAHAAHLQRGQLAITLFEHQSKHALYDISYG